MKCVQTMIGTLAIVGLGYIAGVGHSLVRTMPVILGSTASSTPPPSSPPPSADEPVDAELAPQASPIDPAQPTNTDFDTRLDAPVPDGMLTLRTAHQMWIDGAYFVDSRLEHEYTDGHVSGAAYLTAENFFSDSGQAEMDSIPPDAQVVIYCLGGDQCDASLNTKALLEQYGYTDLSIMGVGYDEWAAAGLPTSSNEDAEGSP